MKTRTKDTGDSPSDQAEPRITVTRPSDWIFLQPAILDQMHEAVIVTDLAGIVTGCNRAAQNTYGYTPEELIGQSVLILYPEEDRASFQEKVIPATVSTGEFRGELQNRTRSGDTIYVHLSVSALRDSDGNPVGLVGFSVDVTAQKLGDLAVRRSDEVERQLHEARTGAPTTRLLTEAVENAQDVFLITEAEPVDQPGPRIVYVNKAFERMTGYAAEEVIGQTPRILQGPKTERAALERIRAALEAWQPVREELTNYHKDGSEICVDLSIFPIANEAGRYTHWISIQRDITSQKRLRQKLADEEARLHFLTEAIPQLLWTAGRTGQCQFVSNSCAHFLGAPPSQIHGNGWYKFIHPEDLDRTAKVWQESLETGKIFITEYRLRRNDGEFVWFLHRAVARLNSHDEVVEWIGSSTDIAQQKRSEEAIRQTEKLAAVGRLASSIAHEINNPLASVTNLLYLLSTQRSLDRTAREYVRTAQEELSRVAEITNLTLRFHKQSTNAAPTRIPEVLDAVLAFFRPRFASCSIQVRREYQRTEQLTCFSSEIRQALSNLIGNSIEATPPGGHLRVRVRESISWPHRKSRGIRVTIGDTGKGIERAALERIFEPFYTSKGDTGTGLGLWITRGIITKHDGLISVWSSTSPSHSGTVISVFLPYEPTRQ